MQTRWSRAAIRWRYGPAALISRPIDVAMLVATTITGARREARSAHTALFTGVPTSAKCADIMSTLVLHPESFVELLTSLNQYC